MGVGVDVPSTTAMNAVPQQMRRDSSLVLVGCGSPLFATGSPPSYFTCIFVFFFLLFSRVFFFLSFFLWVVGLLSAIRISFFLRVEFVSLPIEFSIGPLPPPPPPSQSHSS